jgi:hypothetical protein
MGLKHIAIFKTLINILKFGLSYGGSSYLIVQTIII